MSNYFYIDPNENYIETLAKEINSLFPLVELPFITILLPSNRAVIELQKTYGKLFRNSLIPNVTTIFDFASNLLSTKNPDRVFKTFSNFDSMFFVSEFIRKNLSIQNVDQTRLIAKEIIALWNEVTLSGKTKNDIISILEKDKNLSFFSKQFLNLTKDINTFLKTNNLLDQKEVAYKDLADLCVLLEEQSSLLEKPLILAGTTGSIPIVRKLAHIISNHKNGRVILPGYNNQQNHVIDEMHPFQTQKKWMEDEKISRPLNEFFKAPNEKEDIIRIFNNSANITCHERERFLVFEAPSLFSEATYISHLVRYHLENNDENEITIVTANKYLVKLLQEKFQSMGFKANSSLASSYLFTPHGQFLRLLVSFFSAPTLNSAIALLNHPFYAFTKRAAHLAKLEKFEKNIQLNDKETLKKLYLEFDELNDIHEKSKIILTFEAWIDFIINCSTNLSDKSIFTDAIGQKIAIFLNFLKNIKLQAKHYNEYADTLFACLNEEEFIPENETYHKKVRIIGTIESRHISSDILIVADLNEGSWPPISTNNIWLDQSHRKELSLPENTRRLSLSAHDFLSCLTAKRVYLTRSTKIDGQLQEKSRFLSRLCLHFNPSKKLLTFKKMIERSAIKVTSINNSPCSITEAIYNYPKISKIHQDKISISALELLNKDQRAYYIKYILNLKERNEWFKGLSPAFVGKIVHDILENINFSLGVYAIRNAIQLHLNKLHLTPYEQTFLEKQLFSMLIFATENYQKYSPNHSLKEEKLNIQIDNYLVYGIADRVDFYDDNVKLVDYKTGILPSLSSIKNKESLQMPLLQAMLYEKKLKNSVLNPQYWKLSSVKAKAQIIDLPIDENLCDEHIAHTSKILNEVPWNNNIK